MPILSGSVEISTRQADLLRTAIQQYRDNKGLDATYTDQMFLDEMFRDALISHVRAMEFVELERIKEDYENSPDEIRDQIKAILYPTG